MVAVELDVRLLLESLKATDTCIGEWLNVVGYVTDRKSSSSVNKGSRLEIKQKGQKGIAANDVVTVRVQAVILWSAGAVRLGDYERILNERKEVERRLAVQ